MSLAGASTLAILSSNRGEPHSSTEEDDQLVRSNKRNKGGEEGFSNAVSLQPRMEEWIEPHGRLSYREMLNKKNGEEESDFNSESEEEEMDQEDEEGAEAGANEGGIIMTMGDDGLADFTCTKAAKRRMCNAWRKAIIVKLVGKKLGVTFMKKKLEALWSNGGPFSTTDIGNDYYVVRFSRVDDMELVLTGGPWVILGHYLSIQRWEPKFKPNAYCVGKVTAWVQLPELPMESYDRYLLRDIGNHLGK